MTSRLLGWLFAVPILLGTLPQLASAQEAVLSGTVTDLTGAVLPGVAITAARATGTDMGGRAQPVDDNYITANGTSMATPHVAGAAAILLQENPGWDADQLKAALVSTAKGFRWACRSSVRRKERRRFWGSRA